jgi:hypothetical protein
MVRLQCEYSFNAQHVGSSSQGALAIVNRNKPTPPANPDLVLLAHLLFYRLGAGRERPRNGLAYVFHRCLAQWRPNFNIQVRRRLISSRPRWHDR